MYPLVSAVLPDTCAKMFRVVDGEKKSWVRARNQAKIFKTLVGARNYINRLYNESNLRLLDCFSGSYVQAAYENISIEHLRATELFDTIEYPFLENQ